MLCDRWIFIFIVFVIDADYETVSRPRKHNTPLLKQRETTCVLDRWAYTYHSQIPGLVVLSPPHCAEFSLQTKARAESTPP
jgi:hypothetical protein